MFVFSPSSGLISHHVLNMSLVAEFSTSIIISPVESSPHKRLLSFEGGALRDEPKNDCEGDYVES